MTSHSYSPLVYHVLEHVTYDRLAKAALALTHGDYTITFTSRSDSEIGAYVANGERTAPLLSLLPGLFAPAKTACSDTPSVSIP
jgi:hypothetical protein